MHAKPKQNIEKKQNLNVHINLKYSQSCEYHSAQMSYTTQYRGAIFSLNLIAQMLREEWLYTRHKVNSSWPVSVEMSVMNASPHSDNLKSSTSATATSWYWQLHRVGDDSIASIFSRATENNNNKRNKSNKKLKTLKKYFSSVLE